MISYVDLIGERHPYRNNLDSSLLRRHDCQLFVTEATRRAKSAGQESNVL